ncbi:MAG TPA: MerR family transcriptional regulator [Thermoanaerobaculia bacterium]
MTDAAEDKKLYKIGEVCKVADVQPYVLRYWETEFPSLAPNKSGGGQRLYTKREIDIILRIKQLLYSEGFTIAGAKKKLETEMEGGVAPALAPAPAPVAEPKAAAAAAKITRGTNKAIADAKKELRALLEMLKE